MRAATQASRAVLTPQVTVLGIPRQGGGLAVHIVLLLRLFRMWRVIKLVEVRRLVRACAEFCTFQRGVIWCSSHAACQRGCITAAEECVCRSA